MKTYNSTTEQFNKLIEFRQEIYERGLLLERDTQFELIDALLLSDHPRCFAEISLSPVFRRQWSSAYSAIERGSQAPGWISDYLSGQVPAGVQVYPLDTTMWAHPSARTLEGMVYGRSPTKALKRRSVVQGHEYSVLAWTAQERSSWSPPISVQRVKLDETGLEVGLRQVKSLCQARVPLGQDSLTVIAGDGAYGNHLFFGPLKDEDCAVVARMRRDRVLYGVPGSYSGLGRPRKHGHRFAFKEPDTWLEPDEEVELSHERWGQVRLRRWNDYHAKQDADSPFHVILAEVHLEREKPPRPLWLGYLAGHTDYSVDVVWSWFDQRWPVEPGIGFRKQQLAWTLPNFQHSADCDKWTTLTTLAHWQLFLGRELVQDNPLPWQKPQAQLTPGRVRRGLGAIFVQIDTPAQPPQTRGKSSGWPAGRSRTRPERYKVTKRGKKRTQKA